jgi:hypothetical protein
MEFFFFSFSFRCFDALFFRKSLIAFFFWSLVDEASTGNRIFDVFFDLGLGIVLHV